MSDEASTSGETSGEQLEKAIEDVGDPESGGVGDDDTREAVRLAVTAVAGSAYRDERGRILSGHPAQWKPGQSGNPAGQPSHAQVLAEFQAGKRKTLPPKLMTEAVREVLADPLVRKKLAEKWVLQSAKNAGFMKQIWERIEGKVPISVRLGPEVEPESQTDLSITVVEAQLAPEDKEPVITGVQKPEPEP